jgi:hypothetical protein
MFWYWRGRYREGQTWLEEGWPREMGSRDSARQGAARGRLAGRW